MLITVCLKLCNFCNLIDVLQRSLFYDGLYIRMSEHQYMLLVLIMLIVNDPNDVEDQIAS
jgi:hypothetical protein